MENKENDMEAKVSLMTLHAAKGLEFDTVFLPGWEEGVFPHQRSLDEVGLSGLEEERRLADVGITRAKREAVILYAANRRIYNQWMSSLPSRFVEELPSKNIEHIPDQSFVSRGGDGIDNDTGSINQKRNLHFNLSQRQGIGGGGTLSNQEIYSHESNNQKRKFEIDTRIFHQKFGYGKILSVEGNKLDVDFEKAGIKKVIDSFVDNA